MSILAEAPLPVGRHFAQLHRNCDALSESVASFLTRGIREGQSAIVVASPELRYAITDRLADAKLHPKALTDAGQIHVVDATTLMATMMPHGHPEWPHFRGALERVLARVQASGSGVRIFSEMSGMLWRDGNTDGAIRLEQLWNALGALHAISVYCGYTLDTQCEETYAGPLEEVGHAHTEIVGTEADERFGLALDRASKEVFGITLSQMAGLTNQDGGRRFPSGQRTMLWVKRNLPLSTAQLAERARRYFQQTWGIPG